MEKQTGTIFLCYKMHKRWRIPVYLWLNTMQF